MSGQTSATANSLLEDLEASRARLWKVLTEGFGGVLLLSADGTILHDGIGSKHLLGHVEESHVGKSVFSRIHPADLPKANDILRQVTHASGATSSKVVMRCLHADGTYRWIEGTISNYLGDPEIGALVCHWHEVTKWIETEKELRELTRFHRAVIDTAAEGVCVGQIVPDFPFLRFSFWNERMTEITGCTLEQINGRGWMQTLQADSQQQVFERFGEVARGQEIRGEEWTITRPDGADRIVVLSVSRLDATGAATPLVFLVEDVTGRWQAQRDLELEERRLRTAVQAAGMISWDWELKTNAIRFSTDVGAYFGSKTLSGPGPFPSHLASLLIAEHNREYVSSSFVDSQTSSGDFSVEWEGADPAADGSPRWFATLGKKFLDPAGTTQRTSGVTWEITERRRAEDERHALERKVQATLRLESLAVLSGGMAHEFNNLLTSILGYAGLAKSELAPDTPAHGHLTQIENASCRAAALCYQMLAASGRGRFVVKPLDLSQLIRENMVLLRSAVSRPAGLACALAAGLPVIAADATQLQQLIMNLVTNAAEAMADRPGTINVTTGAQEVDASILAGCVQNPELAPGTFVFFDVSDDGPGMEPEIVGRIFEPFFSTKFTGRGLGLAAVLGIVRGHKGAIRVCSTPGKGTSFRIFLPVAHLESAPAEIGIDSAASTGGDILVVDDEPRIRDLAVRMLVSQGYHAVSACDGVEALEKMAAETPNIRLVLMDLTMPRMDGIETARKLRDKLPQLPIILMSGFTDLELTEKTAGLSQIRFLNKPFKQQDFLEAVRSCLAESQ